MKKQRILGLVLCVVLTANLLVRCGETPDPAKETTPVTDTAQTEAAETESVETESERKTFDVSGINYEGYEFRIWNFDNELVNGWNRKDIPDDMYSAEQTGDMLNDAVYNRNKTVEEALNITFTVENRNDDRMSTGLHQAVAGGSQDVDVLFPRFYLMPALVNKGDLLNMANVDFRDPQAPW